jgi:RHS repeat-associated protein
MGGSGVAVDGSGLLNMRLRNYDPTVGQFIENDPLGLSAGSSNLRNYVSNNPTNAIDPSGAEPSQKPGPRKGTIPSRSCHKFQGKHDNPFLWWPNTTLNYGPDKCPALEQYKYENEDEHFYYGKTDDGKTFYQSKGDPLNAKAGVDAGSGADGASDGSFCANPPPGPPPSVSAKPGPHGSRLSLGQATMMQPGLVSPPTMSTCRWMAAPLGRG